MTTAVATEVPMVLLINGYHGPGFRVSGMSDRERRFLIDLLQQRLVSPGPMDRAGMALMMSFEARMQPSREIHHKAEKKGIRLADGGAAFRGHVNIEYPVDLWNIEGLDVAMTAVDEIFELIQSADAA